jgi:hypothetical protein
MKAAPGISSVNPEHLVLAMMNLCGGFPRHLVPLNRADNTTRVATVDANDHRNAQEVYLRTSAEGICTGFIRIGGDVLPGKEKGPFRNNWTKLQLTRSRISRLAMQGRRHYDFEPPPPAGGTASPARSIDAQQGSSGYDGV